MRRDGLYLVTTKGYILIVYGRVTTPCADVVVCDVKGKHKLFKVCTSNKGEFITVRFDGEYLGRCYLK